MKPHQRVYLASSLLFLAITGVDAQQSALNPTGTWKVTVVSTNTQAHSGAQTLELKVEGSSLTGTIRHISSVNGKSRVYEWPIKGGKVDGSKISFSVTHPFEVGHGEVTTIYQGKINGDTIKGTSKIMFSGQSFTRDWKAERLLE